jgi:hypothetical protein
VSSRRASRLRIPNTRFGAVGVAAGLAVLGFVLGVGLLVVAPMLRNRLQAGQPIDARPRPPLQQGSSKIPVDRPELWLTPVPAQYFPSPERFADVEARSAASAVADVRLNSSVVVPQPLVDALGRPVVSVVLALGADVDVRTPAAGRPRVAEPTQVTLAATSAGSTALAGCVLASRDGALTAVSVLGPATLGECGSGLVRLPSGQAVAFALLYEQLPNFRANDGSWLEGGVFSRVEAKVALQSG